MIKPLLLRLAGPRFYHFCASKWRQWIGYPSVTDHFGRTGVHEMRALLIYISQPFISPAPTDPASRHAQREMALILAEVLDQNGFIVDVVDFRSRRLPATAQYRLIIGIGELFMSIRRRNGTSLAWLGTGSDRKFHIEQQKKRIDDLEKRRGYRAPPNPDRENDPQDLSQCDAIFLIGNDFVRRTFDEYHGPIFQIPNIGFSFIQKFNRNFEQARKKFLFIGSRGQVHKGLDLLLEVFGTSPDLELYICASVEYERDFVNCYHRELYKMPNIHLIGILDLAGEKFRTVATECAFVVLPSCAEGISGSVIAGMQTGLIPIVSPASGIDVDDFGMLFDDCSPTSISEVIREMSDLSPVELEERAAAARQATEIKYSPENLRHTFGHGVQALIELNRPAVPD